MQSIGYYGCYSLQSLTTLMSLLYLIFLIKEPLKKDRQLDSGPLLESDGSLAARICHLGHFFVVDPLVKMTRTVLKKRPDNRRFLLLLQVDFRTTIYLLLAQSVGLFLRTCVSLPTPIARLGF